MKKIFLSIILVASIFVALIGCQEVGIESSEMEEEISSAEILLLASQNSSISTLDYINLAYTFSVLEKMPEVMKLTRQETDNIDNYILNTIENIFSDISAEDMQEFINAAEFSPEISQLLNEVLGEDSNDVHINTLSMGIIQQMGGLTQWLTKIIGMTSLAANTLKVAFDAVIAAVKAWLIQIQVRAAIATVALLVAATVIIYYLEPLKAGFNQLINFFVESAGALGNTIRDVFGRMGADAEATRKKDDAARKSRVDAIVRELTREKKGLVIYIYGNKTNLNLTPRPVDALTGLSFLTIPNYMSNMAISTIPLVNGTGALKAIQDGLQHVSVKPSNDHDGSLLNQWITSRGSSTPHRFTSLLSAVCIEYRVNG